MLKKSFARVALVALLATTVLVAPTTDNALAQTAQGSTSFSISWPNVVILHYWSTLNLSVSTANLTDFMIGNTTGSDDEGTSSTVSVSDASGDLQGDANVTTTTDDDMTSVVLHIQRAFAVRAIGGAAQTLTVRFDSTSATLTGPNSNSIAASSYAVGTTGGSAPTASSYTPAFPGLVTPEVGDVAMTLDFTNATEAGSYTGTWTLEAEIT